MEELAPVDLQHVGRLDPTDREHALSHFDLKSTKSHVPIGVPRCLRGHCPQQHPGFDHEVAQVREHDHRDLPWPRGQPTDESAFLAPPQRSS